MKQYKLTVRDLYEIKEMALRIWVDSAIRGDYFLAQCYSEATIKFISSRNLKILNGNLYEQETAKV